MKDKKSISSNENNRIVLLFIIIIILSILGLIFVRIGFYNYNGNDVTYQEEKNVDYKVYLKPNDFFDVEYLPKNRTYITSLIDYIHIDFDYTIALNEKMTGNYSYYIKGVVDAKETNTDNSYYTKEYVLSDVKNVTYENLDSINIKDNIDVNYQDYNNLLNDFKNEFSVSIDGNLQVILVISNNMKNEHLDNYVLKKTEVELNIPLSSLTVEVPIDASNKNDNGVLTSYQINSLNITYLVMRILGIILCISALIITFYLIYIAIEKYKLESIYDKTLRKILKTYDGVIVNLDSMPNISKTKIINVSSFEELIDAHSEVRHPINYVKERNSATFLLMSDGYTYCYKLKKGSHLKGGRKK